jgi:hypothetical protein
MLTRAPLQFNVEDPIAFFSSHDWKLHDNIYLLDDGNRIGRKLPPLKFPMSLFIKLFPKIAREIGNKTYGHVLFGK